MVDAVVSFVIERLGDYLIGQAVFLHGVKDEVESLKKDLEWMLRFIKDAEHKQVRDELICQWVSDIREIAYDIEDVLDKYLLKVYGERTSNMLEIHATNTSETRQGLLGYVKKCCSCIHDQESKHFSEGNEMVNLYGIGKEIEAIKKRLNDVKNRRESFGLINSNNTREGENQSFRNLRQLRKTTSFEHTEINVVGFEDDSHKLLAKVLHSEQRRLLISIYGTGGLGKTTLARKLYHNNKVKNKFSHRAWVSVSKDYKTKDLLTRIIKSFGKGYKPELEGMSEEDLKRYLHESLDFERMSEEDLERYLHKSLRGHQYLVVIDDVWNIEAWKSLKRAFPDNYNGSRVIITTRKMDVAENSDENTYTHALRFLRPNESWKLFCEKAFEDSIVEERLETLGREMVQKCGGLPLAIVVLGGLLYKKNLQVWHRMHKRIWQDLTKNIEISYLLALSFDDLPYQLKVCFLYLSHFPEDYEIKTKKLIQLWVAEGFIPQSEKVLEEVAHDYLSELISRSLIIIDKMSWGRIKTCRVHDLLRDLAIQKAKELNFIHIYDGSENSYNAPTSCRRQAVYVHHGREDNWWLQQGNPLFRSLLCFNLYQVHPTMAPDLKIVITRFKLLRVIDFDKCDVGIPKSIGKLIHLKYLGIRRTDVTIIPPSIGNLLHLQTLDLKGNSEVRLPVEIRKLRELRHLIGNLLYIEGIEKLKKLQTLKYVVGDAWIKVNPERLVNIRELHICEFREEQHKEFNFDSIAKLKSLRILCVTISARICYFFGSLQPLSHCQHLLDLRLDGKIENLPGNLHQLLPNLERLSLRSSLLVDDPMLVLEKLHNLMILRLGLLVYDGKKMICSAQGFPRLETLYLDTSNLDELEVDKAAMPMLNDLKLEGMRTTLKIPERLRSIPLPNDY